MTRSKKVAIGLGATSGALLLCVILLPVVFSGTIQERLRAGIESTADVRVDWEDASLSLFGDFPHPSLRLQGVTVAGTGNLSDNTLATVGTLGLSVDGPALFSAIRGRGPFVVRTLRLEQPVVDLIITEEGWNRWIEVRSQASDGSSSSDAGPGAALSLRDVRIDGGHIDVDDRRTASRVSVDNLEHRLQGDFSRASVTATTTTHADRVSLSVAGTPYLSDVSFRHEGTVDVEPTAGVVVLEEQQLLLNALELRLDGSVRRDGDGSVVDLTFGAPSSNFGELLSLLTVLYGRDFDSLDTSGRFALSGAVRGRQAADTVPSFTLDVTVEDGRFRYPDLPLAAEAISAELAVRNPGGDLDATTVDLSELRFQIGDDVVDASARIATPISDPEISLRADGRLDLDALSRTVKLSSAEEIRGIVEVDATVRARRSDLVAERFGAVEAAGRVVAEDVALRGDALRQPVDVHALDLTLSPSSARLDRLELQAGESDVRASGQLDNLLAFALGSGTLTGSGTFESEQLMLDEWRSDNAASAIEVPTGIDLTLSGSADRVEMNGIEATNVRGAATARDGRLDFESVRLEAFGGRIAVDGMYETTDPERPTFALQLGLDSLDIGRTATSLESFRALVPVAEYARGTFTTDLDLQGALGANLSPDFDVLEGDGSFATSPVAVEGFPLLEALADRLDLSRFSNPTVDAIRSGVEIEGGRLLLYPFSTRIAGVDVGVTGSNGIDQSIEYELALEVPRAGLGQGAVDALVTAAGPLGAQLGSMDRIPVRVGVSGFVLRPEFDVALGSPTESVADAAVRSATEAATSAAQPEIDEARARADSTRAAALRAAQARADSVVAAAERQAATIRDEAARAASEIRQQAERAATELVDRASGPIQRIAAERAADGIRSEADEQATALENEADARATQLEATAREQAAQILAAVGGG